MRSAESCAWRSRRCRRTRIRDLAIPLARRVLVNQCRTHAAVAHAMYQLASAGAACRCQVVAGVAQIVEVESGGKTRLHDAL